MRYKHLTVLVFFIVQTSIDASEPNPDCLETSEGCPTDSPTTAAPPLCIIGCDSLTVSYCKKVGMNEGTVFDLLDLISLNLNIYLFGLLTLIQVLLSYSKLTDSKRNFSRVCYTLGAFVISIVAILQYVQVFMCPMIYVRLEQNLHLFILLESTILSAILAYMSREWQYLKNMKNLGELNRINIWRELKLETPEIKLNIQSQKGSSQVTIPYSSWWIGGEDSESSGTPAQSPHLTVNQNKLSFISFNYSKKAANEATQNLIEKAKNEHFELTKKAVDTISKSGAETCIVFEEFYPLSALNTGGVNKRGVKRQMYEHYRMLISQPEYKKQAQDYVPPHFFSEYSSKLCVKPENMKLPLFCKSWFFWLFTVLPFPFFNGVLLRLIIKNVYSVEVRKPIVQYLEIRPELDASGVSPVPVMDVSRGYHATHSVMDLIGQENYLEGEGDNPLAELLLLFM